MATLISDLDLAYNQILSASGLFIVQDSTATMLECAPPEGRQYVINVINMTKGVPKALQSLASFWFHWFIIPTHQSSLLTTGIVKARGTRTPSHYSADTQNFAAPVEVEPASRTKKFDDAVKEWEGYHTSIYWEVLEECETDEPITPVQIGHIIPLSMNSPKKATDLGQMWDVIQSYGGLQPGELTGDWINEPFNHLVFGYLEHFTFDTFRWSLVPDSKHSLGVAQFQEHPRRELPLNC
ncbi:hypothetical protein BS47DRAFT_1366198 [Hydnum rufescens UP504]|uniref:Uncharacterized protein n=1 Tax=Hydnum rufescens UP504 TaxID=1448309 RepID=A0A9P6AMP0_9AGAM|nr:hypothetical protein BS47DRAFT_1366198 [Hydnum rufescens UP504]